MIATKIANERFLHWNKLWGAPHGNSVPLGLFDRLQYELLTRMYDQESLSENGEYIRLRGPFGFQSNSTTREYEYPWAYYATSLTPGMKILDIGGGFGGLQYVLSKAGLDVTNVDPGDPEYTWNYKSRRFDLMNRAFGTNVKLIQKTLRQAEIAAESRDRVFCISVLEHLTAQERQEIAEDVYRVLKPGGYFIVTCDLFLDIEPFADKKSNKWGTNMNVADFIRKTGLKLIQGKKSELTGFKEFVPRKVLSHLDEYLIGATYPVLSQLFVLQKP